MTVESSCTHVEKFLKTYSYSLFNSIHIAKQSCFFSGKIGLCSELTL